ncbi:MAG TPA: AbrB/MazE/SpoVT family DNA-binding domain-containing protein [Candidatus Competibacteraceae bacterium]|nr:AbrB/MazE/SpoVT family DNA-binding domain-containing protein [Candidatus Competibacteraceae bacterium]HRZ07508.1 AbrB/MazE/SpoVT family DNA-binding domain-containing protein [Candidatus Competibacteraceae bacterium]HSA47921.1 AbrB/MazE/SpoVT family DNA-binding domain-containing protein [Candidatus Competibacteraceae bacterium]
MTQQVLRKWGNSPAIRIPAAVMRAANLNLNQNVEIKVEDGRVIIESTAPSYALDDLLAGITPANRHEAMDFGAPQGSELV